MTMTSAKGKGFGKSNRPKGCGSSSSENEKYLQFINMRRFYKENLNYDLAYISSKKPYINQILRPVEKLDPTYFHQKGLRVNVENIFNEFFDQWEQSYIQLDTDYAAALNKLDLFYEGVYLYLVHLFQASEIDKTELAFSYSEPELRIIALFEQIPPRILRLTLAGTSGS